MVIWMIIVGGYKRWDRGDHGRNCGERASGSDNCSFDSCSFGVCGQIMSILVAVRPSRWGPPISSKKPTQQPHIVPQLRQTLLNTDRSKMKQQMIMQSSSVASSWLLLMMVVAIGSVIIMPISYAFSSSFLPSHQSIKCQHQRRSSSSSSSSNKLYMGLQVKIRIVGRKNGGEKWLDQSYSTYETRLKPTNLDVTTHWHKNDEELLKNIESDISKNHKVILLDPLGKMCTSEVFSDNMYKWLEIGGSRLTFCIGGADGLPTELRDGTNKSDMFSLSSLTFTHQFARILLMEQIYRASEIRRGSGYHK